MSTLLSSNHHAAAQFGPVPSPIGNEAGTPVAGVNAARTGSLRIDPRLNGPRRSANGGFAAGAIARHVDADTVSVILRRPIPLGRPLDVIADGGGGWRVMRRSRLLAEAHPGRLDSSLPPSPPSFDEGVAARSAHPLIGVRNPFSDCVVCAPLRIDGMHVTPGFVPGRPDILASVWVVDSRDSVAGTTPYAAVWAAMDCTSYPASALRSREFCLLGTMTAAVDRRPHVGDRLVVYSWTREHRGRRYETSAALVDDSGSVLARADATWISLRHQRRHTRWLR